MIRFEPGDTVSFTHGEDWMIGEVEEIRKGHEGDSLLVVRQGGPWSGSRYIVLSSYVEKVGEDIGEGHSSTKGHDPEVGSLLQAFDWGGANSTKFN